MTITTESNAARSNEGELAKDFFGERQRDKTEPELGGSRQRRMQMSTFLFSGDKVFRQFGLKDACLYTNAEICVQL